MQPIWSSKRSKRRRRKGKGVGELEGHFQSWNSNALMTDQHFRQNNQVYWNKFWEDLQGELPTLLVLIEHPDWMIQSCLCESYLRLTNIDRRWLLYHNMRTMFICVQLNSFDYDLTSFFSLKNNVWEIKCLDIPSMNCNKPSALEYCSFLFVTWSNISEGGKLRMGGIFDLWCPSWWVGS